MNNKQPLVSVIMPVYNAGKFVSDAIESILNQTYDNFELIIINDASTDNSYKIISSYKKRFSDKIKVINLKKNLNRGGDACANLGILKSKGEFIARMDADDIAVLSRLEKQVNYLSNHPKISLVGSNAYFINADSKVTGVKKVPVTHNKIYREFFVVHPLIHPTIMIRRKVLGDDGLFYDIKYKANNDYLTFMKLLCKGNIFANLKSKLLYYRIHSNNDSLNDLKSRFINTVKIRIEAVFKYGYKPTFKDVFKLFLQIFIVTIIPEKVLRFMYEIIRGVRSISDFLPFPSNSLFARLKKAFIPSL